MVSRYLQATQAQQSALRGATEEIDIDAAVPKFKKQGKLHALRSISKLGQNHLQGSWIQRRQRGENRSHRKLSKSGSGSRQRPLRRRAYPPELQVQIQGCQDWNGRQVYVLHVNPREKKVGLFKGELWLDAETYMPVRESGFFVKSPSFMLKKMQFVRDYELQNGVSIPQRTESRVETRFFGKVELNINYLTFSKDSPQAGAGADDAEAVGG